MSYSQAFNDGINFVLPHEDEYARGHWGDPNFVVTEDVPGDTGGLTKYGIDQASNPGVDIANLTQDQAIQIYWNHYWNAHNLDSLPEKLAICCFDVWVNGGHANLWLQHAINQTGYQPHLAEDGSLGPVSLAAAAVCDQAAVVSGFISERNARFVALANAHPNDQQFLKGWEQRDSDLAVYLTNLVV